MFLENMKICDEIAFQKGMQLGKLEGISEGEQRGKLETAKAMFAKGLDISLIAEVTGLAISDIEALRH